MIDSSCSFSFYGKLFFWWLVFPFMVFPYKVFCNRQHKAQIFRHSCFCLPSVKFLQCLRMSQIFPLNYCFAGATQLYLLLIHCETKPYLNTLPKQNPSWYIIELYTILIHYRSKPYPNTLSTYTLSQNITKVSFHIELKRNSSCRWYKYPQVS